MPFHFARIGCGNLGGADPLVRGRRHRRPAGTLQGAASVIPDAGLGRSARLAGGEVVLSAGSLNSTEILLRAPMHWLSISPALGTGFNGNGDFFGLAYNTDSC